MRNYVISYRPDTDLRYGHDGLRLLAKREGKDPDSLKRGEFLFFVNRRGSAIKALTSGNCLIHVKSLDGGALNFKAVKILPKYFNGTAFNYKGALKEAIEKDFDERFGRRRNKPDWMLNL